MENLNIHEIWQQHESRLTNSHKLNIKLLKEVKISQAKSSLKSLLFLPISTLIFFIVVASYGLHFTVTTWGPWYFAFAGIIVTSFSLAYIINSIRQLKQILTIDYKSPVVQLQKEMSQLRSSVIVNLKIAAGLLPFAPFLAIFIIKSLFDYNLVESLSRTMLFIYGGISLLLLLVSIQAFKALSSHTPNKTWLNWLLKGSGSQVDEALSFLQEINAFENEK